MYALIALGYTLVYGILLMINFAHSEMFMGGAFVALFTFNAFARSAFFTDTAVGVVAMFALTFLIAGVFIGILGVVIERLAYRPLRHAPRLAPLTRATLPSKEPMFTLTDARSHAGCGCSAR